MNLIFVNRFFFPDHSATSQMVSGIAFGLHARGARVTVVTSRLCYVAREPKLPSVEAIDGVEVRRVWTSSFGRSWLFGRAIDYFTFYIASAIMVLRLARRGDVVIVKTDPPMLSVVLWPVTALRGANLVNWLQDIFPEVAIGLGVGARGLGRIGLGFLAILRNVSLRRAAIIVVLGEHMAEFVQRLGVKPDKIRIIPNWADGRTIYPVQSSANGLRKAWGFNSDFVIGYSGNLGRAHDYATFIDAIRQLESLEKAAAQTITERASGASSSDGGDLREPDKSRRIRWLFVGGGAQFEAFKNVVEVNGLRSVVFKPYQPQEHLAESLSVPDVHLITLKPELEGLIVPSKFYGIAAAGRPAIFVGDRDGEIARILNRHRIGSIAPEGDGAALAAVILGLASDPALASEQGHRARHVFDQHYDLALALGSWQTALESAGGQAIIEGATGKTGLRNPQS